MMISILHKLLSMGTVAVKPDTGEVLSEVPEENKACMVNHIKDMGRPHRPAMTRIQPLRRTRVRSDTSTRHLAERALLPEVSAAMGVLGRHNHRRMLSSILAPVPATTVVCLMYLGKGLSRPTKAKTRELAPT